MAASECPQTTCLLYFILHCCSFHNLAGLRSFATNLLGTKVRSLLCKVLEMGNRDESVF